MLLALTWAQVAGLVQDILEQVVELGTLEEVARLVHAGDLSSASE